MWSTHAGAANASSVGAAARDALSAVDGSENCSGRGSGAMYHSDVNRMHVTDGIMVPERSENLFGG